MAIEDKPLKLTWTLAAWEDDEYWQGLDKKPRVSFGELLNSTPSRSNPSACP